MEQLTKVKNHWRYALIGSLTLGLAPFVPEPHLLGKIRWVLGGAEGMQLADYFDLAMHGLPWVVLFYYSIKYYQLQKINNMNIQETLKASDVKIIDVREKYEFDAGHIENAIHMPLSSFDQYIDEIKSMKGEKKSYCRSGNRSGQAVNYLSSIGVENVQNGGSMGLLKTMIVQ